MAAVSPRTLPSIIPQTRGRFRDWLKSCMGGLTVHVDYVGLQVGAQMTDKQVIEVIKRLLAVDRESSVTTRFCIGDAYNDLSKRLGSKKAIIAKEFGEEYVKVFKQYGWVARKWKPEERDTRHTWTYFVNNEPGAPVKTPRDNAPVPLQVTDREVLPDGIMLTCEAKSGQRYTVRLPPSLESGENLSTAANIQPFTYRQRAAGYGADLLREEGDQGE